MVKRCILFDVDNTLYPRECGLFPLIEDKIKEYLRLKLGLTQGEATALRRRYLLEYGFTLIGLMNHHRIDPQDYLDFVHEVDLEGVIGEDEVLVHILARIPLAKIIFTNGTQRHARRVLQSLGIEPFFPYIFDIAFVNYIPKPHPSSFKKVLGYMGVAGRECIMVDDHPPTLMTARELGMTTIHVGKGRMAEADYHIGEIRGLEEVFRDLQIFNT